MKIIKTILLYFLTIFALSAQKHLDLFILAGQSNAQGFTGDAVNYPKEDLELDKSILLNYSVYGNENSNGEWLTMQAQKGRYPAGHFGPEVSLARNLKKTGYQPAIFKYTLGGTSLAQDWKAPHENGIYDHMTKNLTSAIESLKTLGYQVSIRGFIWIQGESDAVNDSTANKYETNLKQLISDLRLNVLNEPNLKIILGVDEQHQYVKERSQVVAAQQKIAQEDKNIIYTTMYGLPKSDNTHLTPLGLVEHGNRLFSAFEVLVGSQFQAKNQNTFADNWEYKGVAIEEPGYVIWGTSPIEDDLGKIHLFAARWPGNTVEPGWRSDSEIAHYVGDNPEGPFRFADIALKGSEKDTWDRYGIHNPTIKKINNKYVLLYIGNNDFHQPPHPSNQKIGMVIADSPYGPWEKVNKNGLILDTPSNDKYWNYKATNGVNNPTLLQHPNGGYYLYFKSEKAKMGLAIAEKLEGPYVQLPFPVTQNQQSIEDGYAFMYHGQFALLTTDNHGIIESGGGILWKSDDGIHFDQFEKGFHRINDYLNFDMSKVKVHYGAKNLNYAKFERPQLLFKNENPAYLYLPSGTNINGGLSTECYILKFKN